MSHAQTIAHYTIERELGRGGMGVVYRAIDTRLGRPVAMKSLPHEYVHDVRWRTRFEAEAKALAAINHPNIASIYGIEDHATGTYLVLELAEGPTLGERIHTAPPTIDEALAIARQVALGIGEAHLRRIVHRDLKPANVKVRPDGLVKVLDFGIAKSGKFDDEVDPYGATMVVQPVNRVSTVPAFMLGTPGYMSPEQARGQHVTESTDIWAIGCILYECLAHRMAFPGDTLADAIAMTILGEPDWSAIPRRTPGRMLRLIQTCLKKNWQERALTMPQVASAIEDSMRELSVGRVFVTSTVGEPSHNPDDAVAETGNVQPLEHPLIGRDAIVQQVAAALDHRRLITLTGNSGSGLTSIANAAALTKSSAFKGGTWWVSLPALADPSLPPTLTALALRTRGRGSGVLGELVERIGARAVLLVLDGCAHAPAGPAAMAVNLLRACPNLRVLTTAAWPLNVEGEHVIPVPALGSLTHDAPAYLDPARLFLNRVEPLGGEAAVWRDRVHDTVRICKLLDGNPQAIELSAGLAATMSPTQFEAQLRQRSSMMGTPDVDSLTAEQVLALVAAWSVDVQQPANLALLMRASVFVGPWSIRAMRAVTGAQDAIPSPDSHDPGSGPASPADMRLMDQLARLAQAGLVRRLSKHEDPTRPNYILPQAIRREALNRLRATPGAEALVLRSYRTYAHALAAQAAPRLTGPLAEPFLSRLELEFAELTNVALAGDPASHDVMRVLDTLLQLRGLA